MPGIVVLGARNLGGVILDRFLADGWKAAAVARSDETLTAVRERGAVGIAADATDPRELAGALADARAQIGEIDAIVGALSVATPGPGNPWGGGPLLETTVAHWDAWTAAISRMAYVFLSEGARALQAARRGGTLIQVSNSAALRPTAGEALLAAGQQSLRALVRAGAQELREHDIRACLLVAEGPIDSPKTKERMVLDGVTEAEAIDQDELARAAWFLATQGPRGTVYELTVTASGRPWTQPS
jgi:NAD(P)-dependent dehydrogenase (short-subunit alcohol dehydrogenase family)